MMNFWKTLFFNGLKPEPAPEQLKTSAYPVDFSKAYHYATVELPIRYACILSCRACRTNCVEAVSLTSRRCRMRSESPRRPDRSRNPADLTPARPRRTEPPPPSCLVPGVPRHHSAGNATLNAGPIPVFRATPCIGPPSADRTNMPLYRENSHPASDSSSSRARCQPGHQPRAPLELSTCSSAGQIFSIRRTAPSAPKTGSFFATFFISETASRRR